MKAMILAAGRGNRMEKLTQQTPKPLIKLRDQPLIEHRILALKKAGFTDIVINLFYLGDQIANHLGNGSKYGVNLQYAWETEMLDVGGGIKNALPLLGKDYFLITSTDIDTDFSYEKLHRPFHSLAHLVLVDNPSHHPQGDFYLDHAGLIHLTGKPTLTYMNIAVLHPSICAAFTEKKISFLEMLTPAITEKKVSGEYFKGYWVNMDTPERLALAHTHTNQAN